MNHHLLSYRLRKALTTQLHTLRQELGPKEETLMRVTEKLQETDREYELSLQAIAEKEKNLGQKSESLNLLQKQVCLRFLSIFILVEPKITVIFICFAFIV